MKKRILSILTALCLLATMLPMTALAADVGTTFDAGGITYEVTGADTVSVTKKGDGALYSGDISIPASVEYENATYSVTAIGQDAFRSCVDLGAVTVPSSVKAIGQTAFGYIGSPFNMGKNTFSITLNEGLETIGAEAFIGSRKLKSIHIPASVTTLGPEIFQNCTNLNTVTFAEDSKLTAIPASCFYCNAPGSLSSITLPAGLTSIGYGAFCNTKLKSIHIPDGVTEIPDNAFYNTTLETVTGLDGVTKIGKSAFERTRLTGEFTIPNTVTEIGPKAFSSTTFTEVVFEAGSQLTTLGSSAFLGCWNLTEIAFPDTVTELPEKVLEGCSKLTSVTLPDNITTIPANAFKSCSSLTKIEIPESVTEMDATAFSGCTSLKNIDVGESTHFVTKDGILYNGDKTKLLRVFNYADTTYEIPDSVTTIAEGALVGTTITEVTFPENSARTVIAENMFKGCSNLTSITLPGSLQTIEDYAFFSCTGLTNMVIPEGVTAIGRAAFSGANKLETIQLPSTLTSLGRNAFINCSSLKSVVLPDQLEVIEYGTFQRCSNLESVKLPKNLREIGESAFYDADALTSIQIPEGTTTIGTEAFASSGLTYAVVPASVVSIGADAFPAFGRACTFVMMPTAFTITGSGNNIYGSTPIRQEVKVYCPVSMVERHKDMLYNKDLGKVIGYDLSLMDASLSEGSTYELVNITAPDGVTLATFSNNEQVATVTGKTVTGVSEGTAIITAQLKVGEVVVMEDTCTITVTAEGAVLPTVKEPETNTDKITDTDDKKTAGDVAGSVAADETITSAAQSAANSLNSDTAKQEELKKEATEQGLNPGEGETVNLYTQTYLNIEATELAKDESDNVTSITLNITPMMQVVASTATNSADIKLDSNGETNAVVVQDPKPLTIRTEAEITVTLPENFKSQPVFVRHEASNDRTYFYQATADGNCTLTFTSYHGFSPFTFSLNNEAVAFVDGIGYASFQEAVNAAADGDVVEVFNDDNLTATVSGSSRTITVKNSTRSEITVTLNGQAMTLADNATQEYTYTRPSGGGGGGSSVTTYAINTPSKVNNGTIKVSPTRASKGTTVTITVTPDEGYELAKLTVTDKNGETVKLTDKGNGKYTFTMPASAVEVEVSFQEIVVEPDNPFTDVYESDYYYDAVLWAVENGVTAGTGADTFSPNAAVSRAQMVTFLWRAHGSPKATGINPFTDVSTSDYYYDAVLWAVANGVTAGTSATTFSPNADVTRAQAVTFQWRAAGSPAASSNGFGDVDADTWYYDAVSWAVANGVTSGTGGNNFSPNVVVSRAQAVTFLYRELG